nr:hypothetical protein [Tanacetum cinerariifolium]
TPISAAKPAAKPKVLKIVAAAPAVSTRKRNGVPMKKKDQIEMDAEYARKLQEEEESFKNVDWNTAFDHVQAKDVQAKEDENLKKQLEVVVDEDDDVFIEAT